jgi:hypothetical protein
MKISQVNLNESDGHVSLTALCSTKRGRSTKVYFKFSKKYKSFIAVDASPFAAAILLPSMKLGEDLTIEGKISKQLYDGMHEIMDVVCGWDIGLRRINIKAAEVANDTVQGDTVATCFSGGVDSFYTWLKHKNDTTSPVQAMLFVNGYDISLDNKELLDVTVKSIKTIANEENAQLIQAESNIRTFIDPILGWGLSHGGCLAAAGLCLRQGLKLMYIPSSRIIEQQRPWGTSLFTDHLWSTEKLSFIHDGAEASRVNKVVWQISKSPVALKHLRVCWKEVESSYNCGVCSKCIRTMVNLRVAGVLDQAATFPNTIDNKRIANMRIDEGDIVHQKENIDALKERDLDPDLRTALQTSLDIALNPSLKRRILKAVTYLDNKYTKGTVRKTALRAIGKKP